MPIPDEPPSFHGAGEPLASLATRAWLGAAQCAGRPAAAASAVEIAVRDIPGGFRGMAHFKFDADRGSSVLVAIELSSSEPTLLAHEVAHAWVHEGPSTLVEGAAAVLADCVIAGDPLGFRAGGERRLTNLEPLEDMRSWVASNSSGRQRAANYEAAHSLFAYLSETVPLPRLLGSSASWSEFAALLANVGPHAVEVSDALAGGVEVQRRVFGDADSDGLIGAYEQRHGFDPRTADTDGDGWWDGVPTGLRERAIRLPRDGTPICVGDARVVAPALGGLRGGAMGGGGNIPPQVWVGGRALRGDELSLALERGGSVALSADRVPAGFPWVILDTHSQSDPSCWSDARRTVFNLEGPSFSIARFLEALQSLDARADRLLGPPPKREVYVVGDELPDGRMTSVPLGRLQWGESSGNLGYVAALAVASERLRAHPMEWRPKGVDVDLIEALARHLAGGESPEPMLAPDATDVATVEMLVAECAGDWRAYLAGACQTPE